MSFPTKTFTCSSNPGYQTMRSLGTIVATCGKALPHPGITPSFTVASPERLSYLPSKMASRVQAHLFAGCEGMQRNGTDAAGLHRCPSSNASNLSCTPRNRLHGQKRRHIGVRGCLLVGRSTKVVAHRFETSFFDITWPGQLRMVPYSGQPHLSTHR